MRRTSVSSSIAAILIKVYHDVWLELILMVIEGGWAMSGATRPVFEIGMWQGTVAFLNVHVVTLDGEEIVTNQTVLVR